MPSKLRFLLVRLGEQLWMRPLVFCCLAVIAALAAAAADHLGLEALVPRVEHDTVDKLLSIIAASMLGVATFAVGSMVSAYASASGSATPRAFTLVISDDVSKTALSSFIAAFIFAVIGLIAIQTGFYGRTGLFAMFLLTIAVLGLVLVTFIRWVDKIARLGRLGTTIDRVEKAAEVAIARRRRSPTLGGRPVDPAAALGEPLYAETVGYVQHLDVEALQACAQRWGLAVTVAALPGAFAAPGRALAHVRREGAAEAEGDVDAQRLRAAFVIGHDRVFADDPRFGLIALAEIAARALSPAVNDPGTAIDIIGTFVRLFDLWVAPGDPDEAAVGVKYDRVHVPPLAIDEMFGDAFTAIARDGAGAIEVVVRLQKAFLALAAIGHSETTAAARLHSGLALARAEKALTLPHDVERARALAAPLRW